MREAVEETKAGLRLKTPKTENSVREISVPDMVVEALREHRRQQREQRVALGLGKLDDSALLFPRLNGEPQSPRGFSKEWADVAASIGLLVTFHALRHTHASHLIDAGIDVVKISRRLGHASVDITLRVYAHLFQKRMIRVALRSTLQSLLYSRASLFQGYATLPLLACFGWQSGGKWVQSFTSVLIAHRLSV